jgi:hypothetical protein
MNEGASYLFLIVALLILVPLFFAAGLLAGAVIGFYFSIDR